jgi:hypothetical protein
LSLITAATPLFSHPAQFAPTLQQIPGTNLKLKIPSDWKLEKAPGLSIGGYSLKHIGKPESVLSLSQSASPKQGHSCASLFGSMRAVFRNDKSTQIIGRPPFIHDRYFGSALSVDPELLLVCLSTGDAMLAVQIQLRSNGSPRPDIVTPVLAAIAEAATSQSKVVFSPGRVKLPLLGIEVPVQTGAWGVMTATDGFGTNDVLARAASSRSNELLVTPFFSKDPGTCTSLMANSLMAARSGATLVRGRNYGSAPWHPDAWEMFPPPFRALEAFVCRDVGQKSKLLVRIEYEKPKITAEDAQIVRQLLDDLGQAVDRKFSRK